MMFSESTNSCLEVSGRKKIWKHIRILKAEGMNIFMTTINLKRRKNTATGLQ
jgi:ABC-2 type transport system ATP-binding protein